MCFNPRPRAGSDASTIVPSRPAGVSIHAPAREATPRAGAEAGPRHRLVSIHAPAREATLKPWGIVVQQLFQSTPPRGKRLACASTSSLSLVFQSTPPRGKRRSPIGMTASGSRFNPRPRAGSDSDRSSSPRTTPGRFNPRPRAGSDVKPAVMVCLALFQSTPPRGKRRGNQSVGGSTAFQSTPPRGKRRMVRLSMKRNSSFQSTPPRGKRPARTVRGDRHQGVSIHAPAREATSAPMLLPPAKRCVSIHAPAREATRSTAPR